MRTSPVGTGWRHRVRPAASSCVVVALLTAGLAACGGVTTAPTVTPSPSPPAGTGIAVTADAGPTCPVERVGQPPCVRPVSVRVDVTTTSDGRRVASVTTDSSGHAMVALLPGDYVVTGEAGDPFPRAPAPQTVHVGAGAYTDVALHYDTGIR